MSCHNGGAPSWAKSINRRVAVAPVAIAALVALALLLPASALARAELGVSLTHSPLNVFRGDEQVTYTVHVANEASAGVTAGETLFCNGAPPGKSWINASSFQYQWLRNGVVLESAEDLAHGSQTDTYTTQSLDQGGALQCRITGTNASGTGAAVFASEPSVVVEPQPTIEVPQPISRNSSLRPKIAGEATAAGQLLTCTAPTTGWTGQSIAWTFHWLRNGDMLDPAHVVETTATTSTYELQGSDVATVAVFQCESIASNVSSGGSAAVAYSNADNTAAPAPVFGTDEAPTQASFPSQTPLAEPVESNAAAGPIRVTLELPEGSETRVVSFTFGAGSGTWTCSSQEASINARAELVCESASALQPRQALPAIEVRTAVGADAPEPLVGASVSVAEDGVQVASALDEFEWLSALPFGIESFTTKVSDPQGNDYTQAGGHPFAAGATIFLNSHTDAKGEPTPVASIRNAVTSPPPGFVGNPMAVPQTCDTLADVLNDTYSDPTCPRSSIVGSVTVNVKPQGEFSRLPLYSVPPEEGAPAQFEFAISGSIKSMYALTPRLRPAEGYAISLDSATISQYPALLSVAVTLCSYGARVEESNIQYGFQPRVSGCNSPADAGANLKPFLTNPTECSQTAPVTKLSIASWEHPGAVNPDGSPDLSDPDWKSADAVSPKVTGCDAVPFGPKIELEPASRRADSPTGLDVSISVPPGGLETAADISQSALKKAVVTLPQGMAVNPSAADGLGACALSQIKLGTNDPVQCPESSKIGSAEVVTPLLAEHLDGNVYLAKQGDNPFHSLLALYLVVESKERGILVKIPGKVEADPQSGRLVATFDDNPQLPFSSLKLHFNEGNRAPLLNPPACGSYGIVSQLSPWSAPGEPRTTTSTFRVTEGPHGGPCPNGALEPKLEAGLQNPVAGTTSPFTLRLSREDGTQRFRALDVTMPPGLTAYLKGVPYCPDSALASVSEAEGTGQAQIEHPSCPAASEIGTVSVGAGGGSNPFYVNTGRAYLAGPYKGAPLSIAIVTPAVAGPFDLGSVVVRSAVHVDPETAKITVDSDPIPTILHGIPLDVRDIRVNVDRPQFTLAPTSCEAKAVGTTVSGEGGATVTPSNRFQVGDCAALGFRPGLKLRLKGATGRTGHPSLKAVVTMPQGGANIRRAQVNLPHSEFLDQGNLNRVCRRPVLMAGDCPKSTIYGHAKAWTPLLSHPLQGNVYLVGGYGYKLPALVADLNGQVRVTLAGKVDSGKNHGIRNTFEVVPDAPVSRFVLRMKGGKKYGLLENSENLCTAKKAKRRAIVRFAGQNGKVRQWKPVVGNQCGRHKKKTRKRNGHGGKKAPRSTAQSRVR